MSIDTGVATFLPTANEPLDISEVVEGVKSSGFELLWLEFEVLGSLSRAPQSSDYDSDTLALTVFSTNQRFLLFAGETDVERSAFDSLVQRLEQPGAEVRAHGRAFKHGFNSPAITVR